MGRGLPAGSTFATTTDGFHGMEMSNKYLAVAVAADNLISAQSDPVARQAAQAQLAAAYDSVNQYVFV